jgi:hypothetical protein
MVTIAGVRWLFMSTLPLCLPVNRHVVVWAGALHFECRAASGGNADVELHVDGSVETLPIVCQVCVECDGLRTQSDPSDGPAHLPGPLGEQQVMRRPAR